MSLAVPAGSNSKGNSRLERNVMRKVVASLFVSLDGVMEAPEKWHFPYFNDEMGEVILKAMSASDALLLGRRTYQEFAAFWPNQPADEDPMATFINESPKYVVSTSLEEVDWKNSTLLRRDVANEVKKLKGLPGKDISISGSATLVRSLLREGLLDELRLMIHPVVVGSGRRLFENGTPQAALELVDSETFSTGVVDLTYRPARA
jgi:dihydrofolate reductase